MDSEASPPATDSEASRPAAKPHALRWTAKPHVLDGQRSLTSSMDSQASRPRWTAKPHVLDGPRLAAACLGGVPLAAGEGQATAWRLRFALCGKPGRPGGGGRLAGQVHGCPALFGVASADQSIWRCHAYKDAARRSPGLPGLPQRRSKRHAVAWPRRLPIGTRR